MTLSPVSCCIAGANMEKREMEPAVPLQTRANRKAMTFFLDGGGYWTFSGLTGGAVGRAGTIGDGGAISDDSDEIEGRCKAINRGEAPG